ncbi:MAG: penicillin acylase family protein [Rhodospirillales bacterium]|nr:MAG: penicillin acylase family protein [Rhodospirillales bacterium]
MVMMGSTRRIASSTLVMALALLLLGGCALLTPLPETSDLDDRLAAFPASDMPLEEHVTIHWDEHQVPFIEAETDGDAAFALGLVHAHLRLGQMAIYKRIARGRIAEMGGPLATDIDHGLRILDFGRAAADIAEAMSPETRLWVDRFVAGINHYQDRVDTLPLEYRILGLGREPWTIEDVITFGRLSGVDVNWLVWFNLLDLRDRHDWPQIWARLLEDGSNSQPSFAAGDRRGELAAYLSGLGRTGSNSLALAPERTASGAAILVNDPHLGVNLPNTWLIVGLKSPTYHAVGLMVPGLPLFAIGRNPWIAWGGTNMRALSSDLVDVSDLAPERIRERRERIGVRWWLDREVVVRETPFGPVLSDAPLLDDYDGAPFALTWTGHQVSDEMGAMLAASRARDFDGFRKAFAGFAVPGQNMLYADAKGNIGQVMAIRLPTRANRPPGDLLRQPAAVAEDWQALKGAADLPFSFNPPQGFLASANNRPTDDADIAIGYFFSPDDRVQRMARLASGSDAITLDEVKAWQRDVYMESSVALRDHILAKLAQAGLTATAGEDGRAAIAHLRAWDGHYHADSVGALAFELFRAAFTEDFYQARFGAEDWAAFAGVGRIKAMLLADIAAADAAELDAPLRRGLAAAVEGLATFETWGDMHRLELRHPLAFLPVVGGRFRFAEYPVGGGNESLMKTAHGATRERHTVRYGSNARHISDLSDPDANYFVLLGGQDGWVNSSTFLDQVELWRHGQYIRVPLTPDRVRAEAVQKTELPPADGG